MNDGPSETQLAKIYDSFQVSINEEIYVLASWFGRQCKIIQTKSQSKRIRSLSRDHIDRLKEKKKKGKGFKQIFTRWMACTGAGGCFVSDQIRAVN